MTKQLVLSRLRNVRKELERQGLDAIFATHGENPPNPNVRYLSAFSGSTGIIIVSKTDALIITDGRYFEQVEQEVVGFELRKLPAGATYNDFLSETIKELGVKSLGFDPEHTLCSSHQKLANALLGIELKAVPNVIEDMRIVKSKEEIGLIRKACEIAIEAFLKLVELNVRGKTERELAAYLDYEMRMLGAEKSAFDTILCSGPRSSVIHGLPSDNELRPGDLVIVDFGAVHKGYRSDLTRTCVVGEPSAKQQEQFFLLKKAQSSAAKAAKPGAVCKAVDAVARDVIKEAGYGDKFGHGLGHGIGLLVHEAPQLGPTSETELREDMLITIEPGIYFPGEGGLRLEDDFIVKEGGAARIADGLAQDLFVLRYD